MHFGIGAFLGMWTFGLIMTYGYFAFGNPEWWRRQLSLSGRRNHGRSDGRQVPIDEVDSNILSQHTPNEWDEVANEVERPAPKSTNAVTGAPQSQLDL
ncbi:MAG TPA: hypothetical protein EYQ63_11625 [Fuerstia sp.]|nr:hypothetical protein [Fuerstiella sp.]